MKTKGTADAEEAEPTGSAFRTAHFGPVSCDVIPQGGKTQTGGLELQGRAGSMGHIPQGPGWAAGAAGQAWVGSKSCSAQGPPGSVSQEDTKRRTLTP